ARRPDDRRGRCHRAPRGRHHRGQRADDGPGVSGAGGARGAVARRRRDAVLDDAGAGARTGRPRRPRRRRGGRSGRAGSAFHGRPDLRRRPSRLRAKHGVLRLRLTSREGCFMRSALTIAALLACSGCVDITGARFDDYKVVERETKRFSVSGKPEVRLSTHDGSIEIRPADKSEVEVVIEKRGPTKESLSELIVDATQNGDVVSVEVR